MERYQNNFKKIKKLSLSNLRQSFFKTCREKGYLYFASTRVESCKCIKVKNGKCISIPFLIINRKCRCLSNMKAIPEKLNISKSTYMNDYIKRYDVHCGLRKKPFVPYSMNSLRNQLPINCFANGGAVNRSCLELGDSKIINRKKWKTTYRDFYRNPKFIPVSNIGISSDMAQAARAKLTLI